MLEQPQETTEAFRDLAGPAVQSPLVCPVSPLTPVCLLAAPPRRCGFVTLCPHLLYPCRENSHMCFFLVEFIIQDSDQRANSLENPFSSPKLSGLLPPSGKLCLKRQHLLVALSTEGSDDSRAGNLPKAVIFELILERG